MKPTWTAEGVELWLGDCLEVLPTLAPESIDSVVTDPPYGIFIKGGKWGKKVGLQWDRETAEISNILRLGKTQIVWGGNYYPMIPSRGWLVWHKPDSVPSTADCELAWTSIDMNTRYIRCTIAATNPERNGHPTMKPLAVMLWSLSFIPAADSVCDPFIGSGTTGVACVRTGRKFIGIEKEPRYFDIAVRRIETELNRMPLFEPPAVVQRELI